MQDACFVYEVQFLPLLRISNVTDFVMYSITYVLLFPYIIALLKKNTKLE